MKIIFLGMQGSGKSTQAKLLSQKLNLPYIEMGQLLRDKTQQDGLIGQIIKSALQNGKLVENEITIQTLKDKISQPEFERGYILDGYPRNKEQLPALDEDIDKVFYIEVPDEEAIRRLTNRGRHDDTPELIEKRIEVYHQETEPLLAHFRERGLLEEADGQRSIEEVANDIWGRVEKIK